MNFRTCRKENSELSARNPMIGLTDVSIFVLASIITTTLETTQMTSNDSIKKDFHVNLKIRFVIFSRKDDINDNHNR